MRAFHFQIFGSKDPFCLGLPAISSVEMKTLGIQMLPLPPGRLLSQYLALDTPLLFRKYLYPWAFGGFCRFAPFSITGYLLASIFLVLQPLFLSLLLDCYCDLRLKDLQLAQVATRVLFRSKN